MKKPRKPRTCRPPLWRVLAVLLDLDGTLIESERALYAAWVELAAAFSCDFTTFRYARIIGKRDFECCEIVARHFGWTVDIVALHARYKQIVFAKLLGGGMSLRPGAREFLDGLKEMGIRTALVTSAGNEHVAIAHHLYGVLDYFDKVVTASSEGLTRGKPWPEPYRMGAGLLRVPADRCLAVEDSPSGVLSARRAGAYVIGIPHEHSPAEGLAKAQCILPRIDQVIPTIFGGRPHA